MCVVEGWWGGGGGDGCSWGVAEQSAVAQFFDFCIKKFVIFSSGVQSAFFPSMWHVTEPVGICLLFTRDKSFSGAFEDPVCRAGRYT